MSIFYEAVQCRRCRDDLVGIRYRYLGVEQFERRFRDDLFLEDFVIHERHRACSTAIAVVWRSETRLSTRLKPSLAIASARNL